MALRFPLNLVADVRNRRTERALVERHIINYFCHQKSISNRQLLITNPERMDNQPAKEPGHSLLVRIRFAIRIRIIKLFTTALLHVLGFPRIRDNSIQPTFKKSYPCRPKLENRVFFPKSYKSGDVLPLYLSIHGGGFALMSPKVDDRFCSYFSNKNKVLVVSLDYPKSPDNKFPGPSEAIVDLVLAVLGDDSLPFDPKKVAMGGFSAGANLSLSAAQYESLQGKIAGIVSYYPPADFSYPINLSIAERPKEAPQPDMLAGMADLFHWAYIKPEQDLKDPLLSPTFARKERLPPKIFILGCEYDMLCRNSEIMAEKFANARGQGERKGRDVEWEKNGIKWELILGEEHGK